MALGGGIWTRQDKVLPGAYTVFSNAKKANAALSSRGIVALPIALDFGETGKVFEVSREDFMTKSKELFGYRVDDDRMRNLREVFLHATKVLVYRLVSADATAASNTLATAKYAGKRGNDIKIVVGANVDKPSAFDVSTYLDNALVDTQTVDNMAGLKDNAYVTFKSSATLSVTAGMPLSGGANGSNLTGEIYTKALESFEAYSFNILCCPVIDSTITKLFVAYTKRLRDEVGLKFQTVVYKSDSDYEGIISINNDVVGTDKNSLVYWVSGAEAGCEVNKSLTNAVYDGEYEVVTDYKQSQLETAIKQGKFTLHNVNGDVRVLEDINSFVSFKVDKDSMFSSNQTIRVIDQIANDIAALFNTRYLGVVPNDNAGRISLWNDICKIHQELEKLRAIESFDTKSVDVVQGDDKKSVLCTINGIDIINAMTKLYLNVIIA
ncbi:phage tail sheath family protein [Lachnoanaerobaculum umeaense]|uniref:Phage tail protein n=1 Tax=Lachnoanaerobaculum umeaense TaxID=617123 RepID=A0A385Q125_9FIRM|nr:phage tail sheath family protein [Lachnoanaerobaculum umeaense]AYB00059.1 phage tail protein [Lachnoanaerobaculum umeaense]PZW97440.1 tail sheath protein [Lachnoanaerobaculum umeaense]